VASPSVVVDLAYVSIKMGILIWTILVVGAADVVGAAVAGVAGEPSTSIAHHHEAQRRTTGGMEMAVEAEVAVVV
jgi:hypothetical protein